MALSGRNLKKQKALKALSLTTAADAAAAAGAAPTKAEYDALVALANELKADHNALVNALRA